MVLIDALDHQRKSLILIVLNQRQNFVFTLHYNADISYFFVNGKEIIKFKADNKNVNFTTQMSANESREVSLNGKK